MAALTQNHKHDITMDHFRKLLLYGMAATCLAFSFYGAAAQNLTVATYNIRNENKGDAAKGNGWDARYPWICSLIEFEGVDIFGSQEVLEGQLGDMLAALPEYGYIGAGRDDGKTKGEGMTGRQKGNMHRYFTGKTGSKSWTEGGSGCQRHRKCRPEAGMPPSRESAHGDTSRTWRQARRYGSSTCTWTTWE